MWIAYIFSYVCTSTSNNLTSTGISSSLSKKTNTMSQTRLCSTPGLRSPPPNKLFVDGSPCVLHSVCVYELVICVQRACGGVEQEQNNFNTYARFRSKKKKNRRRLPKQHHNTVCSFFFKSQAYAMPCSALIFFILSSPSSQICFIYSRRRSPCSAVPAAKPKKSLHNGCCLLANVSRKQCSAGLSFRHKFSLKAKQQNVHGKPFAIWFLCKRAEEHKQKKMPWISRHRKKWGNTNGARRI